jgi:hypothetical protein
MGKVKENKKEKKKKDKGLVEDKLKRFRKEKRVLKPFSKRVDSETYEPYSQKLIFNPGDNVDLSEAIDNSDLENQIKEIEIPEGKVLKVSVHVAVKLLDKEKLEIKEDHVIKEMKKRIRETGDLGV